MIGRITTFRLAASVGSVFAWLLAVSLGAQTYQVLHSFEGPDGANPFAAVIADASGNLYGTTVYGGGLSDNGTVFKLDAANNYALTTLHSFGGADGANPLAAVIADASGNLYGTTSGSPLSGYGTVFKLDAANNYALTTLHSFDGSDGAHPLAAVIADASGNLYGTTSGDFGGYGTVFKLDAANNYALTTLHSFGGPDGAYPYAAVIADASGHLYGTTRGGGTNDYGTVFKLDAANNYALTTLHSFDADGAYPRAAVIADASGNLYGTTSGYTISGGGPDTYGTVFKLDAANNYALTTLHSFDGDDGAYPFAAVIADASGHLYGTTFGGQLDGGDTVFKLDAANNYALSTLHSFGVPDGAYPYAAVLADASGHLFGTGSAGSGAGVVFSLSVGMPAPVTGITPTSGHSGGGTAVTITGSGFSPTVDVRIGGALATGVTVVSSTEITALTPPVPPGKLNDVAVTNLVVDAASGSFGPDVLAGGFFSDFLDVPQDDGFHDYVETLFRDGITAGYGNGYYGRDDAVTRAQMAVFLLKSKLGAAHVPPACTGSVFTDVPCTDSPFDPWIEELAALGITGGCGGNLFCPGDAVLREQMAVLLLKGEEGSAYAPPDCTQQFDDVACPSQFADWIGDLHGRGVTGGCSVAPALYCPTDPGNRGEMAVFLVKTFGLD